LKDICLASSNVSVDQMSVETTLGQQGSSCPFKGHQAEVKWCVGSVQ